MASLYKTIYPVKYFRDYLSQEIRPDGREFLNFRPISVNVSSITQADASAIFKIGNTTIVCGIKAELAEPKADAPDCGFIIPNVELSPLCSSKFRPGPPSDQAQVASKMIDDILIDSEIINLKDLCICKNKLVWVLYCDLECIDCDGSIIDACVGALIAALSTLTLPEVNHNPDAKTTFVHPTKRRPIAIRTFLASCTFSIFENDLLLADPTDEEETQALARLTIVMDSEEIFCVHKPGGVPISIDLLQKSIAIAKKRTKKVTTLIKTAINDISS
ncbi:exosome complex component RRP43-like [Chelonus insularis]|uniref:exosome complex component RRP43-like n=1 Tax=Chelonus insularis TaxID=460826 RepID=UPI00158E4BA9|nr:exosome complex component RRP43-like [Chelonus insularis]